MKKEIRKRKGGRDMKKIISVLVVMMLVSFSGAYAALPGIDLQIDLNTLDPLFVSGETDVFKRMDLNINALSTYDYSSLPAVNFTDVGEFDVTALVNDGGVLNLIENGLLGGHWNMNGNWNVAGNVSSVTPITGGTLTEFIYSSGTFEIYVDWYKNAAGTALVMNGTAGAVTFTQKVAELTLVSGMGHYSTADQSGAVHLVTEFSLLPVAGFWDDASDNSLDLLGQPYVFDIEVLSGSGELVFTLIPAGPLAGFIDTIETSTTGHADLIIPEPATMLLLGSGLLGLLGFRRKKK